MPVLMRELELLLAIESVLVPVLVLAPAIAE